MSTNLTNETMKITTERENVIATVHHQRPGWLGCKENMILPREILDNAARAFVADGLPFGPENAGGKDMFGVTWVYEPQATGSMVIPGNPILEDAEDWEEVIKFPNLDEIDWDAIEKRCLPLVRDDQLNVTMLFTGLFERLISFMDFENAAVAMIDEDQQEAVLRLFSRLTDYYIDLMGRLRKYCHIDMVVFHDDWGHQRSAFFSEDVCRRMLLPSLTRLVNACHENGMLFSFHSCGKVASLLPVMIDAGVDKWDGQIINDIWKLLDLYGDRLCIHYNEKVPEANPDQAARWASSVISHLTPDSGKNVYIPARSLCPEALQALHEQSKAFYGTRR